MAKSKFMSDLDKSHEELRLDKDDPEARAKALRTLIQNGQEDLAAMIGVHNPIPSYSEG